VLDVGTGSGILAIAAALLGASYVLGIDTDPLAVATTGANAASNGLGDLIETRTGSLPLAVPAQFHLVVANLIAGLLIELAPELAATLWPGGRLLAGGIYRDRESEVQSAFESAGCGRRQVGGRTGAHRGRRRPPHDRRSSFPFIVGAHAVLRSALLAEHPLPFGCALRRPLPGGRDHAPAFWRSATGRSSSRWPCDPARSSAVRCFSRCPAVAVARSPCTRRTRLAFFISGRVWRASEAATR
jgi:SAM-dependent methyltransferase